MNEETPTLPTEERAYECKIISSANMKGIQDYQSMDESHNWIFQKSDTYGKLGLLVMFFCDKCGAERVVLTVKYAENIIP